MECPHSGVLPTQDPKRAATRVWSKCRENAKKEPSKTRVSQSRVASAGWFLGLFLGLTGDISERTQETIEPEIYFKFPTTADVF